MMIIIIGKRMSKIIDSFALIENANTAETMRSAGALTNIRSPIITVF